MICKNCGIEISDDSKFCVGCGIAIEQPVEKAEPEVVAAPVVEAEPVVAQPLYQQPVYAEPAKKEITEDDLPDHLKPMGAWSYFGLQLLFAIPIVGFVFLIVFSFSRGNLNRRSFARSYWCAALVGVAVFVIFMLFALVLGFSAVDFVDEFRYY
ncbi:MAG: zinc-ribbon domain-containing protein [Ruminococcaceae bacterium]|nr:zinc-ribbon domain-containing protein [Oscillospiraceae bacterium]